MALWAKADAIDEGRLRAAKAGLVALIAVTSLLPLFFVQPDEAPLHVNVFKYLAKTGAFLGSLFMVWQFLLGFRGAVSSVLPDLSFVVDVHKQLGQFGVPLVLLHPVFIGLYYVATEGQNIYALDLGTPFSWFVLLGMVLLALVAAVVVTSLLRERLGFRRWLTTHLSTWLVPPMLFVHSFALGQTVGGTGLRWYWWFLTALVAALMAYRAAHRLGFGSTAHRVTSAREVAKGTTEILMAPQAGPVEPALGQFVYVRGGAGENAHPYTVSAYDADSGTLGVTVSAAGPQSCALQGAAAGDRITIDGPFGVFTRPAMATDLKTVLVAGGVGITAFRRLWQQFEADAGREAHLFYANEHYSDIAYRDELDALEHVQVVHVLNDEPDFDGEQGLVDADLLRRHLDDDLPTYQFLVCGPPPMVVALAEELAEAGVPDDRIRNELFAS